MAIKLTERAVEKVKELREDFAHEKNLPSEAVYLRMGVRGGGGSGLSYSLEFDTKKEASDKVFDHEYRRGEDGVGFVWGFEVVVDVKSYLFLNGATLDYVIEGLGGGFTFDNPNAKSSCGCGTSFQPEEG